MEIKDSFKAFANRVMHALRMGRLAEKDIKTVEHLLIKTEKKNLILSRAILSTLAEGEQSEEDVKKFARMLELASRRIAESKEPFSNEERKELEEIFKRHSLSAKAARKFAFDLDELLTMELQSQIGKTKTIPKKEENILKKEERQQVREEGKELEKERLLY